MASDTSRIDVSIITGGHDVADARLHRLAAALRRAGLAVEVVGLGAPEAGPADCEVRTLGARSAKKRLKADLTLPFKARGKVLLTVDPDMVPGATLARWFKGRKVVADVHEDYLKLLKDRAWARARVRAQSAPYSPSSSDDIRSTSTDPFPSQSWRT